MTGGCSVFVDVGEPGQRRRRRCPGEVVMAISTTRPSRDQVKNTVYYGGDTPRTAANYCRAHGRQTLNQLITALTPGAEE